MKQLGKYLFVVKNMATLLLLITILYSTEGFGQTFTNEVTASLVQGDANNEVKVIFTVGSSLTYDQPENNNIFVYFKFLESDLINSSNPHDIQVGSSQFNMNPQSDGPGGGFYFYTFEADGVDLSDSEWGANNQVEVGTFVLTNIPIDKVILTTIQYSSGSWQGTALINSDNENLLDWNGGTGFNITLSVTTPVELTTFKAKKVDDSQSLLTWATASELNNDRFEVERSVDGVNFEMIGEVAGQGTTTIAQDYDFVDARPAIGTNYYRLRQVDYDGTFAYTDIEHLQFGETQQSFSVFPNPVSDQLYLTTPFIGNESVEISVFNNLGQLVLQQSFVAGGRHALNTIDLANGLYLIQATIGKEQYEESIVVQRQ